LVEHQPITLLNLNRNNSPQSIHTYN